MNYYDQFDLYKSRLNHLKKFIELKAPREIIYFSCMTLLKTKYKNSYKMAYSILMDKLTFDLEYILDWSKYYIYRIWLSREEAINKVFPEEPYTEEVEVISKD